MDWNQPTTYMAGVILMAAAFVTKQSFNTRVSLAAHKLHAAEKFATKEELKDAIEVHTRALERVEDKLDTFRERRG